MSGLIRQFCSKINSFAKLTSTSKPINIATISLQSKFYSNAVTPHEVIDPNKDKLITGEVIKRVHQQVSDSKQGRLFAVVHIAGKQFKVTDGDVIIIEGYWPPTVGDKISLDKVLMLGASDFTLIGRPLIQSGIASVQATVIEKMLSHTKTNFKKKRRKQYMRINFYRIQQTMLRINHVKLVGELNNPPDVTDVHRVML